MCTQKAMHLLILTFYKQVENTFLTKIPTAPLYAFNQLSNYLQLAQHSSHSSWSLCKSRGKCRPAARLPSWSGFGKTYREWCRVGTISLYLKKARTAVFFSRGWVRVNAEHLLRTNPPSGSLSLQARKTGSRRWRFSGGWSLDSRKIKRGRTLDQGGKANVALRCLCVRSQPVILESWKIRLRI